MSDRALRGIFDELAATVARLLPRVLTQASRDPLSPHYGCFDRNWWHYKIRDFPSVILQQGGYTLWQARHLPSMTGHGAALGELAAASVRFWQDRALRAGAFEEYYPWEQGYPPLAFSTLSAMKLVAEGLVPPGELREGARVAARQLLTRFEARAANQQVAGLAALAWLRRALPDLVPESDFARVAERSLALQSAEGWFMEYDGPDLGYLSVTLDCLWDLHDATGDPRYLDSGRRALDFLHALVAGAGAGPGMHNARNTDYILPYGLLRFAAEGDRKARESFVILYAGLDDPGHFLHGIDDRYLCHYVGHSLVRSLALAEAVCARSDAGPPGEAMPDREFPDSGHVLVHRGAARFTVSLRKGGLVTGRRGAARFTDFGWTVRAGDELLVTHWWGPHWRGRQEDGRCHVEGALVPHRFTGSSPAKHAALRGASRLLGPRLIAPLKNRLIFQGELSKIAFARALTPREDGLEVEDRFTGLPSGAELLRSPRSSKRHVASADSFHEEDFAPLVGVTREERRHREGSELIVTTRYRFEEAP